MRQLFLTFWVVISIFLLVSCSDQTSPTAPMVEEAADEDYERGPNNGRLLIDNDLAIELAIFETGVPPEFRAWATFQGNPVSPTELDLEVTLTRLGDELNVIGFAPLADGLRGDSVIYEPHSFYVDVNARFRNNTYHWNYASLEGRTDIVPEMAAAFEIETDIAGPATLEQSLKVIGNIKTIDGNSSHVTARFDGPIQSVNVRVGDRISQGENLLTIESNQSLRPYSITAPISGVVTQRNVNPGEQSNGQVLLTIMDTSQVWAELAIHPGSRHLVREGSPVVISTPLGEALFEGIIGSFKITVDDNQAIVARVLVNNSNGQFPPGSFVEGQIKVAEIEVPLAVRRSGLQPFRDFTVVFAKVGNTYEVRMLELGRQDDTWIEVLGGLDPGTEYVTVNSYILKADVEKSGASHDH